MGFCVDIGVPKSVIGRKELYHYLTHASTYHRRILSPTNPFSIYERVLRLFRRHFSPFSNSVRSSQNLYFDMDIVDADIPALLEVNVLDKESITPCTISNRLIKHALHALDNGDSVYLDEWYVLLLHLRSNHLHTETDLATTIHFTRTPLAQRHC